MNRFCGAALLLSCALVCGQAPTGEIRLEVKDPSGAPMEASGRIQGPIPGGSRTFDTNAQGGYGFTNLPYGRYQLEVSKSGFAKQTVPIEVQSATPVAQTIMMSLSAVPTQVDVVATTPLQGVDLPLEAIPAAIQTATQADIQQSGALDLSDFLNRRLNGVYLNEMQSNPFQPDVNYRGYTASPLLGTPQGLSVYMDGVRQNQPFGDVVSWDLIPRNAISEITVMPGSNPLFGLNTLGGALSIQTKDGLTSPGLSGEIEYGSSGRKSLQAEAGGGKAIGFNWFFAANAFHESGWRVDSPSDIRQGFGRLGWRNAKTDLALTMNYAYNTLTGNGLQDYRLLAQNYSGVFTIPDTTGNRSPSFNFIAKHIINDTLTFSGNAWYRNIRTEGINGNANADSFGESVYQPSAADIAALKAAGYTGYPTSGANASNTPFPSWRCIAQALQKDEPSEKCDAVNVFSKTVQNDYGVSGQLTKLTSRDFLHNQFTAGAGFDRGTVTYTQNTQFGYIDPDGRITGVNAWQDGSTNDNGEPVDTRVNLRGITPNWSIFATDTLSLGKAWNVTVSGRYNRSTINNSDRINPVTGPGSLNGDYSYGRFNPSFGVTYNPTPGMNAYVNFSQGSRAPTSIELGCADPNNPCNLPNALASDPPLSQVVTNTWEAGLRGRFERNLNWSIGGFRASNKDDILFVASEQTGSGYFQNFAKTLREGVQASLNGHLRRVSAGLDYTFLSATYQSTETLDGTANSTSDIALSGFPGVGGVITVHPGNRIPLIPKNTGKAFVNVQATSKFVVGAGLVAVSSSYARGNENNAYRADGKYYLGPGVTPGYAVVNAEAHYDLTRRLQLAAQADNLFDRHYYTAAQLAHTPYNSQGMFVFRPLPSYTTGPQAGNFPIPSATFFSPGAPRRAWVELRLKF